MRLSPTDYDAQSMSQIPRGPEPDARQAVEKEPTSHYGRPRDIRTANRPEDWRPSAPDCCSTSRIAVRSGGTQA